AFSPDGRTLAAIASDQSYCVWDSTTGKKLKQVSLLLGTSERAKSVHHTAEGPVMLVYKREEEAISTCLWNMATDKRSPFVEVSRGALIPRLAICPNGKFLAYENKLCEIATGRIIRQFKAVETRLLIYRIDFSPNGNMLAYWIGDLAGDTGTILLVDVSTGKKILHIGDSDSEFPDQRFRSAPVLSPDGRFVAYWERPSDRIHVKNTAVEPDADWSPRTSGETPIAFSPDSRTLITRDPSRIFCVFGRWPHGCSVRQSRLSPMLTRSRC